MNVVVENAKAVVDKIVKDGKIIGLTKWNGCNAKIVILDNGVKK